MHFWDVHFSLGEKQILEIRCIEQHAFWGRSIAWFLWFFECLHFDVFFDTPKGGVKPRKEIEMKVPRRSGVEISISRTCQKGAHSDRKENQNGVHSEFWETQRVQGQPATLEDHPELPLPEEGQSRGAESPKRGPASTRKTYCSHDPRLLSCYWRSWYSSWWRWFLLCYPSWWQQSGIRCKMGRILLSMTKMPWYDILESLHKLRHESLNNSKTVLELYDMEIHQKILMPNHQRLKTIVKRSLDQKLWLRNFDARHEKIETGAVVKGHREISGVERGQGTCYQWKEKERCSKGDQCSFRHESNHRAKPKAAPPSEPHFSKTRGRIVLRRRNARGRSQSEKFNRPPCKHFVKGTCSKSLPNVNSVKRNRDESSAQSAHSRTGGLKNNQTKSRKRVMTKVQLLLWKVYDSWVVYPRTLSRQILQRFLGRAEKCWNHLDEYDSRGLHCVKQTSEKKKRSVAW